MKYPISLLALMITVVSGASAEQVVQIHPLFDSGRVATRDLATTGFAQWTNGTGSTQANNVGWNDQQGIWYSFIRFAGTRAEGQVVYGLSLADWHAALTAAGSVTLRGDVNWHEVNPDCPVEPGVRVSVWLIPGLEIPEGSLPSFANTWPWNYPHATKVTSFGPEDVTPLHASWWDAEFDPTNTRDKMAYALEIDLTEAIQVALAAGQMSPTTPWGIVFFPEAMEDQLNVPNNPQWLTRQQTVLHGGFWEVSVRTQVLLNTHPVSASVGEGGTGEFSVEVSEGLAPSFLWQSSFDGGETFSNLSDGAFFGAMISGATADTLTISSASLMLNGMVFRVAVTVGDTVEFSEHANLEVVAPSPPVFLSSPVSRSIQEGSAVGFSVSVGGFPAPSVHWQVSTDGGATFVDLAKTPPYSGVGTTTLWVEPVTLEMEGHRFRAVAENSAGTAESAAVFLTVTPLPSPPAFALQPQDQSVSEGSMVIFQAEASGHPAPAYQWQISFDQGGSFSNITSSSFGGDLFRDTQTANLRILSASSFIDGAIFRAKASNTEGQTFSIGARLTTFAILSLSEWLAAVGVPADFREPADRHGPLQLANLEAYGMGLSPFEATASDLLRIERSNDGSGTLQFHYRVNTRAQGVFVSIEGSTDLISWSTVEPLEEIVYQENEGIESRRAAFAVGTVFLRLRIGSE